MAVPTRALAGGAQAALTTSEASVDLTALAGRTVQLWCDDQDFWFVADADGSGTLVTSGASAASLTSLKAERVAKGVKVSRLIGNALPFLIAKTVASTGTLHVKVVSDVGGADVASEASSAPALGSVTTSSAQLPSALGAQTAATSLSVVKATAAVTDNTTYVVNGNMGADINGPDITVGPEGYVTGYFSWPSTSTPIGRLLLQLRAPDGTTYDEVPGQSVAWHNQPSAGLAGASFAIFEGLRPGSVVRFKYLRTSGGTTNSLQGQTRVS